MEICSGYPKKELRRISWQTGLPVWSSPVFSRAPATQPTNKRRFTASLKRLFSLFPCWPTWAHGDAGSLLRPGNSRYVPSFLKRADSECGRHSWPNSEAFTWERPCRAGRSAPSFEPLSSLPSVAKPMREQAVRLDSIASGTDQALAYVWMVPFATSKLATVASPSMPRKKGPHIFSGSNPENCEQRLLNVCFGVRSGSCRASSAHKFVLSFLYDKLDTV